MKSLESFYSYIISWDNLIKRGYFNITKDKKQKNVVEIFDNPYAKYDSLFAGDFNLNSLIQNKKAYEDVKDNISKATVKRLKSTIPIIYTIPKDKNTRRYFKYPNFYSYCALVNELVQEKNKTEIIKALINDRHSMSKFFGYLPYNFEVTHRMQDYILIGHSHFFKTDFSTFYPSFYTHALAWLIMGKAEAKKNRRKDHLGNRLDKFVESEQDDETHGIPTGNLVTNIVIEYAMSFFDKELEALLRETTVDFYRYVDDIYFGYDDPKDLAEIKNALQILTVKYDLELNNKKVSSISYSEINQGSKLLNYFTNMYFNKTIKVSQFVKLFNSYFAVADEEFLNGVKGAKKIFCASLQFFLQSLSKSNQKNALRALVKTRTNYELPFIFKIIQLVLDDTNIAERFVHLIEEIQKEERKNWSNDPSKRVVSCYIKDVLSKAPMNTRLYRMLLTSLQQNKSEEAYFIFILMQKFNWTLSTDQLRQILGINIDDKAEQQIPAYLDDIDDFNWLMIFEKILSHMNQDLNNSDFYYNIINILYSMLGPQDEDKNVGNYFQTKHWLLKYELIYTYEYGNSNFKKHVDSFLSKNSDKVNIFMIQTFDNNSASNVNKFYIDLLKNRYSFSE
ncbi:RNA-directed DNA polymerase [Lactobacillus ultunensis]|uniref:Reverse transcriptase domain-containing protein n=1 Tax=Lactobacillus ultunensis DSM 16047 TaxID=525365 RepID=C2EPN3_9LACO|nr:RNA-directed DNA polymerase [Lactobacillus ultunensis]EEJ71505.1 hypothetical protein HMPREF0548_1629 [Lactobacillus ultunensis DSM 16047]QQP28300.1 RNA-directed DNA polymerase [Lactobacillus ultunensis]